jgi:hypothetical protein
MPFRVWGTTLIVTCAALLCMSLISLRGQETQENPFDVFDAGVGWDDSCPNVDDDSSCMFIIRVTGSITPSTAARFEKAFGHARAQERLLITLDSRGGDLASAMKIGHLIRDSRGRTVVEQNATCASACILVFAAGLSRIVDIPETRLPARWLDASPPPFDPSKPYEVATTKSAAIGIHRPALAGAPRQIDIPGVKAAADEAERELREYAAEMNVSSRLIDDMLTTPPEQIRWLSTADLKSYGLGFLDPV